MVHYLHNFSAVVQKLYFFGAIGSNLKYIWCKFSIKKKKKICRNCNCYWCDLGWIYLATSALYLMPNLHFFVQIRCRFDSHFSWTGNSQNLVHTYHRLNLVHNKGIILSYIIIVDFYAKNKNYIVISEIEKGKRNYG